VRQYKIRAAGERETQRSRNLARAWTSAFEHIPQPERRLNGLLSLARSLADAHNAIIFDEDRVIAGVPGGATGEQNCRLFERARRLLEDELITPELYVARLAPKRSERVALHWRKAGAGSLEVARAIVSSCAWALDLHPAAGDPPVGLPDASATFDRLEQLVHGARRTKRSFAVVYVDVESPASDKLVREAIARSLRRDVRANDHLGHLGGETYLALVSIDANEAEAYTAARRLLHAATGAAGDVCANVGVAVCPADGTQPGDLVEKAGAAAMAAASVGSPVPYWYRESAGRQLHERALLRARLCDGDPATLLELRYQPIFDARSGLPCAVSAVTCWRGAQPPGTLAPLRQLDGEADRPAREALERWTIEGAAEAQRAWCEAGLDLRVHLAIGEPTDPVLEAIAAAFCSGDASRHLWVELTARPAEPAPGLAAFARRLRALGAGVGVGAWRLSSPPIDAASGLIDFVTVDARGDLGTLAALALGSVVAPVVIAEGVPDPGRARWVMRHGATALRGDGLAEPLSSDELVRWAQDRRSFPDL
jgi:EAL domain-containing protein (putative c-di-GMP-specific phosphodiesterase class I)/GGDEF domain-containing protein